LKELVDYLRHQCGKGPLESLAELCMHYAGAGTAKMLFDAYNDFLGILRTPTLRDHLSQLNPDLADTDAGFQNARLIGKRFHEGLVKLFFVDNSRLAELTRYYGVF
jgi:hypothetical protein